MSAKPYAFSNPRFHLIGVLPMPERNGRSARMKWPVSCCLQDWFDVDCALFPRWFDVLAGVPLRVGAFLRLFGNECSLVAPRLLGTDHLPPPATPCNSTAPDPFPRFHDTDRRGGQSEERRMAKCPRHLPFGSDTRLDRLNIVRFCISVAVRPVWDEGCRETANRLRSSRPLQ